MGLDIELAGTQFGGAGPATALGASATLLALLAWYGGLWPRRRGAPKPNEQKGRSPAMIAAEPPAEPTPLGKKIEQMLTETRVVLPGVQALLGFSFSARPTP